MIKWFNEPISKEVLASLSSFAELMLMSLPTRELLQSYNSFEGDVVFCAVVIQQIAISM